jgi:hypothetical protein
LKKHGQAMLFICLFFDKIYHLLSTKKGFFKGKSVFFEKYDFLLNYIILLVYNYMQEAISRLTVLLLF